jgi:hypothetical protein
MQGQYSAGFRPRPWPEIREFLAGPAAKAPEFSFLVEIVDSIERSDRAGDLCGMTSMHDLVVTSAPLRPPPFDVIVVRAPGSIRPPSSGCVLVEHLSVTGHDDRIERPTTDAVRLFWRFVTEKFGLVAHPPQ